MSQKHHHHIDIHQSVTDAIVRAIETGTDRVQCPWYRLTATGMPTNAVTHKAYRGVNVLSLWSSTLAAGYSTPLWATYRQWQSVGAQVRRGERSSMIVFYKRQTFEVDDPESGGTRELERYLARASRVFNADQVDGFEPPPPPQVDLVERIAAVEEFVRATQAQICHVGIEAYFSRTADHIVMPPSRSFVGTATSSPTESYYGVLLHELVHWTGAAHRLARDLTGRFGDQSYAMEELIAELGAAFLCARLGISAEPRADHAAYIANWLEVLKNDKRAIFTAASKASDAADYLECT